MTELIYSDAAEAHRQFTALVEDVADKNGWTESQLNLVLLDVDVALQDAEDEVSGFSAAGLLNFWTFGLYENPTSPDTFWASLFVYSDTWDAPGSDDLLSVLNAVAVRLEDKAEQEELESLSGQLGGTASGISEDLQKIPEEIKKVTENPWFWPAIGATAVLLILVTVRK